MSGCKPTRGSQNSISHTKGILFIEVTDRLNRRESVKSIQSNSTVYSPSAATVNGSLIRWRIPRRPLKVSSLCKRFKLSRFSLRGKSYLSSGFNRRTTIHRWKRTRGKVGNNKKRKDEYERYKTKKDSNSFQERLPSGKLKFCGK